LKVKCIHLEVASLRSLKSNRYLPVVEEKEDTTAVEDSTPIPGASRLNKQSVGNA
jgi:hypothetical protein